jgi:hypothetical protein
MKTCYSRFRIPQQIVICDEESILQYTCIIGQQKETFTLFKKEKFILLFSPIYFVHLTH